MATSRNLVNTLISGGVQQYACKGVAVNLLKYLQVKPSLTSSLTRSTVRHQWSVTPVTLTSNRHYTVVTGPKKSESKTQQEASQVNDSDAEKYDKGDMDALVRANLDKIKVGKFDTVQNPEDLQHFRQDPSTVKPVAAKGHAIGEVVLPHPIWSEEEVYSVQITHKKPEKFVDKVAFSSVKLLRFGFDLLSGYNRKPRDEAVWLNRICFLETVAGVPGMVAAMTRHLHSLRRLRRDHGWIHTLLEEAENERMHLMTALSIKKPSWAFRAAVVGSQGVFVTFFSFAYLISPRYCHRFVGYLEEEAVVTYTKCLKDIEDGLLQHWKIQAAPDVAIRYWKLAPDSTMKDVILAIRADEAHHRVVNHTLGSLKKDDFNPYGPGK